MIQVEETLQISVHHLSPYMRQNLGRVLPDCDCPADSLRVVIILQRSRFPLEEITLQVQAEKNRLHTHFLQVGSRLVTQLQERGFFAELIDPRTGYPLFSRAGEKNHDDTAAVKALLGFPVLTNRCSVLVHPEWGTAVYPGILIASATAPCHS